MISSERWQTLSKRDQLAHIASEIFRAKIASNQNIYELVIERAINLTGLSLEDPKWRDNPLMLLSLRSELASVYLDKSRDLKNLLKFYRQTMSYPFQKIEKKWQAFWEKNKIYQAKDFDKNPRNIF